VSPVSVPERALAFDDTARTTFNTDQDHEPKK